MNIIRISAIVKVLNSFKGIGDKLFVSKKKNKNSDEFTKLLKNKMKSGR